LLAFVLGSMRQTAGRTVLGQQIYVKYASLIHLHKDFTNQARKSEAVAMVVTPILKLCKA